MSASLFVVGTASFVFHATLRQTMQLFDDLSMLLLGVSFLLSVYTANQTTAARYSLATVICLSISAISIVYLRTGNILLHTYSFATVLMLVWPRTLYLIQSKPEKHRSALIYRLVKAGAFLATGFILWNIDLEMCSELRSLRSHIGLPWAWLLELHGWWHILTAVAAFHFMELARDVCNGGG
jgi:dihydroceramidase